MEPPNRFQCFSYLEWRNRPKYGYVMSPIWYEPTILEFEAGIYAIAQWPSIMGRWNLETNRNLMALWKERISVPLLGLFRRIFTCLQPFLCWLLFQIGKHRHSESRTRNGARYMEMRVRRDIKWNLPYCGRIFHLTEVWQRSSPRQDVDNLPAHTGGVILRSDS